MDITIHSTKTQKTQFKIKGRSGVLLTDNNKVSIESLKDASNKELFGAGEFEVAGISVIGIKNDENVVYIYEVDGLRICDFGGLSDTLAEGKLTQVGDVDILLLPVCPKSVEIMQQIESYFVIPYGYQSQEDLDKFLKESGMVTKNLAKFSVKKDEIIEDQTTEIIVLEQK
jgi:hypothetical protein